MASSDLFASQDLDGRKVQTHHTFYPRKHTYLYTSTSTLPAPLRENEVSVDSSRQPWSSEKNTKYVRRMCVVYLLANRLPREQLTIFSDWLRSVSNCGLPLRQDAEKQ